MKTTSNRNTPPADAGSQSYERLLSAAQAAQSAADRAVADLASIKRTLSEAPRITQLRREELAKAQQALERVEGELAQAREQLTGKQAEAARLIEAAAEAQRSLAQALISQDVMPDSQMAEMLQSRRPGATPPAPAPSASGASPSFAATLGTNRYTPMPSMHPADLHAEVVEYLRDRDALCPSCGHSLRGIDAARCPGCRLHLSVTVLQSVRAHWLTATPAIWAVRILGFVALVLSAYLSLVRFKPVGCGLGSDCHYAFQSTWAKIMGIPVGLFAVPVYLGILLCTGFINIGLADSTRRKAWSMMSALAMLAGAAGIWFVVVQAFLLRAICPHCLAVDICGIVVALLVILRAPLGKPEKLPERAAGPIVIPGGYAMSFAAAALLAVAAFAAIQVMTWRVTPPVDRANFGLKKAAPGDGLIMKPLEIDVPEEKPAKPPLPAPPKPAEVKDTKPPEFKFEPPDAKTPPGKDPAGKQPETDKSDKSGPASTVPESAQADPVKTPEVKLDLSPALPREPATGEKGDEGKKEDEKDKEKYEPKPFDFAPTVDQKKK